MINNILWAGMRFIINFDKNNKVHILCAEVGIDDIYKYHIRVNYNKPDRTYKKLARILNKLSKQIYKRYQMISVRDVTINYVVQKLQETKD